MGDEKEYPDPAAILAIAMSLSREFFETVGEAEAQALSDIYSGIDGFMRMTMRVAALFESWACENVQFAELQNVWPYLLQEKFGPACRFVLRPDQFGEFGEADCRLVAQCLRLPIFVDSSCIKIR